MTTIKQRKRDPSTRGTVQRLCNIVFVCVFLSMTGLFQMRTKMMNKEFQQNEGVTFDQLVADTEQARKITQQNVILTEDAKEAQVEKKAQEPNPKSLLFAVEPGDTLRERVESSLAKVNRDVTNSPYRPKGSTVVPLEKRNIRYDPSQTKSTEDFLEKQTTDKSRQENSYLTREPIGRDSIDVESAEERKDPTHLQLSDSQGYNDGPRINAESRYDIADLEEAQNLMTSNGTAVSEEDDVSIEHNGIQPKDGAMAAQVSQSDDSGLLMGNATDLHGQEEEQVIDSQGDDDESTDDIGDIEQAESLMVSNATATSNQDDASVHYQGIQLKEEGMIAQDSQSDDTELRTRNGTALYRHEQDDSQGEDNHLHMESKGDTENIEQIENLLASNVTAVPKQGEDIITEGTRSDDSGLLANTESAEDEQEEEEELIAVDTLSDDADLLHRNGTAVDGEEEDDHDVATQDSWSGSSYLMTGNGTLMDEQVEEGVPAQGSWSDTSGLITNNGTEVEEEQDGVATQGSHSDDSRSSGTDFIEQQETSVNAQVSQSEAAGLPPQLNTNTAPHQPQTSYGKTARNKATVLPTKRTRAQPHSFLQLKAIQDTSGGSLLKAEEDFLDSAAGLMTHNGNREHEEDASVATRQGKYQDAPKDTQLDRGDKLAVPTRWTALDKATISLKKKKKKTISSSSKCFSWAHNSDSWWQHHPEWELHQENNSHTCFTKIENATKAKFFRKLSQNQFNNNCTELRTRFVLGTGFAATVGYLLDGFWSAFREGRPFQRSKHRADFKWMYSPEYNFDNVANQTSFAACPSQDITCYFLPISSCQNYRVGEEDTPWKRHYVHEVRSNPMFKQEYLWLSQFFQRPQHNIRQHVIVLQQQQPHLFEPVTDAHCTVLHVRRADATSEKRYPRNYYPLSQYLASGNVTENSTVVLLTDDQTTLEEARYLHPNYQWIYLKRERHRGHVPKDSHFPSGDPALEVMYILMELKLASQCRQLVHGTSNMVKLISQGMQLRHGIDAVKLVTIGDEKINFHEQAPIPPQVFLTELDAKIRMAKLKAAGN